MSTTTGPLVKISAQEARKRYDAGLPVAYAGESDWFDVDRVGAAYTADELRGFGIPTWDEVIHNAPQVQAAGFARPATVPEHLEQLRAALRAENISYGELADLQGYGESGQIPEGDVELLEAAGVPEFPPVCILTGAAGENPDDCTTHDHEVSA